jgi:hypothetical protein
VVTYCIPLNTTPHRSASVPLCVPGGRSVTSGHIANEIGYLWVSVPIHPPGAGEERLLWRYVHLGPGIWPIVLSGCSTEHQYELDPENETGG